MNPVTKTRLSFMMFLQFFIWGAWFVTMGTYLSTELSAEGAQIRQYETQAIGAILAPFIIGLIADRFSCTNYFRRAPSPGGRCPNVYGRSNA
ncbi:MAG: hypothetical protein R2784_03710 [Saprospiraceae bacterium]